MNMKIDPKWGPRVVKTMQVAAVGVTTAIAFLAGTLYGRATAPEPCVANLSSPFNWAIFNLQPLLDDVSVYHSDSWFAQAGIKDSRAFAYHMVELFNEKTDQTEEIYTNPLNQREYWIPSRCYAEFDFMGAPILYRK